METSAQSPNHAFQALFAANQAVIEDFLSRLPAAAVPALSALLRIPGGDTGRREQLRELQENFYREHARLWSEIIGAGADATTKAEPPAKQPKPDPRFAAPDWQQLPFFRYLREAYRLNADYLLRLGELADLPPAPKRRLQFLLRQVADAASPTNFAVTNPEVIRLAAETGGRSLAQGLRLLAADLELGRISMTDLRAFEPGRNVAVTPGSVVMENEVMQLIQYAPTTPQVHARPLLVVPPFINKYYILDLQPENSFVRHCVDQGHTTFILSWRNVPADAGHLGWDDYVRKGVLEPLAAAKAITGADKVNTLGFCVGGTLLATALSVLAARKDATAASVTLLATLLDFSETGDISVYVDREFVEQAEQEYARQGVMPGSQLATTFASLRANELVWHFVINNYLKGREPPAFDLLYWNADSANVPGRLYAWYLRNMYLENNLRCPGKLMSCEVPVDLGRIGLPAYVLATREDHIVPWKTAYASVELLGPRTQFVLGASGHVAGIVNPASRNRRHYWTNANPAASAEEWLDNATQHAGSWWPHWTAWLRKHAGKRVPAPAAAGGNGYSVIEPAPGRYVKQASQ